MDLRYALRTLRRTPTLTAVAIVTLALGIGVNTAVLGFADRLLLRALPFPEADHLATLCYRSDVSAEIHEGLSYPDYLHYRERNDVLTDLAAYGGVSADVRLADRVESMAGEIVSANYFRVLGAQPALGRGFLPAEDQTPDVAPVVILSDGLWRRWFASDPGAIGQDIVMNGRNFTIVGVMPRGFTGFRLDRDAPPAFWTPTMMYPTIATFAGGTDLRTYWGNHWLYAIGRLKPGTSLAAASATFSELSAELKQGPWRDIWRDAAGSWKDNPHHWTAMLCPATETRLPARSREQVKRSLSFLGVTAGLVLLVACLNVANLLLARAAARQREMAVRLAIGAGRGQVLRQLGAEGLTLSLLGGAAGLLVASLTADFLAACRPPTLPLLLESRLDARVIGFALLLSVSTGVLFGLVPARAVFKADLTSGLRGVAGVPGRVRARALVVVLQAALSVVLLVGAGLFVRTLHNARAEDVTVDPGHVLTTRIDLSAGKVDEARGRAFYARLLEQVESLPGVRRAALVMVVPMGGLRGGTNISIDAPAARTLQVDFNVVSPSYFETVGIPVVSGRAFNDFDREGAPPVAIVNEQWARRFWPGQDPIGRRFDMERPSRTLEVVGVVRDGKFRNYRAALNPCFYVPVAQRYMGAMNLETRVIGEPRALATAIRHEIETLAPGVRASEIRSLEANREVRLRPERMAAGFVSGLGALALALTAIGIYGVMSFFVSQRTREIGIRMALGAHPGGVLALVLRQGLGLVIAGTGIGFLTAVLATRAVANLLYGVSPFDPWTYATAAGALVVPAMAACVFPARRAASVDPIVALRAE